MRKIIYGSFVFALLASLGMTLFTLPASASEEFVAKMKPYAGRILSPAEIKKVLTGNTVVHTRTGRRSGTIYEVYWYFKSPEKRSVDYSVDWSGMQPHTSDWSVSKDKGYCHVGRKRRGSPLYCRKKLRLSIQKDDENEDMVSITFSEDGKKDRTRVLKEGEYSGQSY